jgi:hypothetical protein
MKNKTPRNDQIAEVFSEEKNRGRRPLAAAVKRSRKEKLRIVNEALQIGTEADFLEAMRSYGLSDEELKSALEAWREGPS